MVDAVAQIMNVLGLALMVFNLISAIRFVRLQRDVLTGSNDLALSYLAVAFIVLFTIVYALVFVYVEPDILIGIILLGGSAFVTLVLQWLFHLVGSIKRTTLEMAEALSSIIDARDSDLRGHSRHVELICQKIYEQLPESMRSELSPVNLSYAAIFHDIGKLGVPESILNKRGPLDDEEWGVMRQHPRIGADILRPVKSFSSILEWISCHHERMDGSGYYGISGDQIPLASRIIAVADVFSALMMKRSYKESSTYEECLETLRSLVGDQLDPQVVNALCAIPKEEIMECSKVLFENTGQ